MLCFEKGGERIDIMGGRWKKQCATSIELYEKFTGEVEEAMRNMYQLYEKRTVFVRANCTDLT